MKKILCAMLACVLCSSAAIGISGCGCSDDNTLEPGYVVEETEPDLVDGDFGFFIINSDELMVTKYTGTDTDIVIPESYNNYTVTTIGSGVFSGSDITSVEMPDTITTINDYAFYSCRQLTSVTLSQNLEAMGTNVFNLCSSLESIELPASLKTLGIYTFSATGLKSVTIPESETLTSIENYVFYQCQSLTEITIPDTVTDISEFAIYDCPNTITIKASEGSAAETYVEEYTGEEDQLVFESTGTSDSADDAQADEEE